MCPTYPEPFRAMVRSRIAGGERIKPLACELGISRDAVRAIVRGRQRLRRDTPPRRSDDATPPERKRCPTCGAMVVIPCLACALKTRPCG